MAKQRAGGERGVCAGCAKPLTGSYSRSKTGRKYPYYRCPGCGQLNVRKAALEERFLELLDRLTPKPEYLKALRESVLAVWREQQRDVEKA